MSKTKVLYLVYQSSNLANGGLKSLLGILLNLGNTEPLVFTNMESDFTKKLQAAGIRVVINSPQGNKFAAILKLNLAIKRLLSTEKIKVVHCNDIDALWWGIWAAKWKGAKTIFNIRGVKKPGDKYSLKWYPVNFCDEVIFLSHEMKEELQKRWPGAQSYHSRVSYSVVDEPTPNENALSFDKPLNLLIPAVVRPLKKQLQLLRYLQATKKDLPDSWHFHFVGDLDESDAYCRQCLEIAGQMPETVTMHGYKSNIADWYQTSTLTLIISEREGLCRGMIESLAAGTPVVSMEVTSAREILEGHTCGFLVQQGDYAELLIKVNNLVNNPSLHSQLSQNGKAMAQELFNKAAVVKVYEEAYGS